MPTITFNPNGGTVDIESRTYSSDDSYGTLPIPNRIGYTFLGWCSYLALFNGAYSTSQISGRTFNLTNKEEFSFFIFRNNRGNLISTTFADINCGYIFRIYSNSVQLYNNTLFTANELNDGWNQVNIIIDRYI